MFSLPSSGILAQDAKQSEREQQEIARLDSLVVENASQAVEEARRVATEARAAGRSFLAGQAMCLEAAAQFMQTNYEAARAAYRSALELMDAQEAAPSPDETKLRNTVRARAMNGLGNVAYEQGDFVESIEAYTTSAQLAQEIGDELGWCRATSNVANMYTHFGAYEEALEIHEELLRRVESLSAPSQLAVTRGSIIECHFLLGNHARVVHLAETYLPQVPAHYAGIVRTILAQSLFQLGDLESAQEQVEQALIELKDRLYRDFYFSALGLQGRLKAVRGQTGEALELLHKALHLAGQEKAHRVLDELHDALAYTYEQQGDYQQALRHFREYHRLTVAVMNQNVLRRVQLSQMQRRLDTAEQNLREVQRAGQRDPLTGLLNRSSFHRLGEKLLQAHPDGPLAMAFLDLDEFKEVNDRYGHDQGDQLLVELAQRLRQCLSEDDLLCRLGGDEFSMLLTRYGTEADLRATAQCLLDAASRPFVLAGGTASVGASLGLALYPGHGTDMATLQRLADLAMYQVKHSSKNGYHLYREGDQMPPLKRS